jgi:Ras GTPase-activating-like protein IQGAP2/3
MSSHDGTRSARQSKRYSMSALYLSMSANEGEMEIEDDLAKGESWAAGAWPTVARPVEDVQAY